MNFNTASVRLSLIDQGDNTYKISTRPSDSQLASSIKALGCLNPPILYPIKPAGYLIVSGFRRLAAAEQLGWSRIPARIMPSDIETYDIAGIAIADNAQHRELNLIEQARAVEKLAPFFSNTAELINFGKNLGLSLNQRLISRLKRLRRLSDSVQAQILSGAIPLTIALALEKLEPPAAEALADFFDGLRPTLNQQKEMLEWIQEIAGACDQSIPDVLKTTPIPEILADQDLDRPQKLKKVRNVLKERRYPTICRFEAVMEKNRKALNLPADIRLSAPAGLEDDRFSMTITFRSPLEFKERIEALSNMADDPRFTAIVDKQIDDQAPLY
ncbi:MAG: ParB/RepB/Spo0J family partition protein [Desulfobacterales bacterium]|nr:ParB/RepB/Spo0J family partition protein [Desulfobacterales bacterium]